MWITRRTYGPFRWSRTSHAFYNIISRFINPGDRILEFGSSTGHISFRLAREGHRSTLLDIRPDPIAEARRLYVEAGVQAQFIAGDFLEHNEAYDMLWNSGLLQCLSEKQRSDILMHATRLSKKLLLFYPDTENSGKARGTDPSKLPGVDGSVEYSVCDLPAQFCRYYNAVYFGRIPGPKLDLPFDMLWLQGTNTCA